MASVKRRPDGKWRARYRDDQGKEHSAHRDTKRDAQDWLNDEMVKRRSGTWVDRADGRVTLASFYAEWRGRQVWTPGTLRAMDTAMKGCTFADVELGKLRRSHVETWVKTLSTTLAASTVRTRFNNVRAVLRGAVRDRHLSVDPAEGVALPRVRRAEHAMHIPTSAQVGDILEAAEAWFRPFVLLGAFAGLRIGEASAVKVADVDFLRRRLHVERQAQWADGAVVVTPPKYGSERFVSLPDGVLERLSRHVQEVGVYGDEAWLFPTRRDLPAGPDVLRHEWRKTIVAAGVEGFTPHDLRHYFASGLIAAGCDVVTVQRALGHAKATTTLDTYSHLWPNAEDRTRAASAGLLTAALERSADRLRTSGS